MVNSTPFNHYISKKLSSHNAKLMELNLSLLEEVQSGCEAAIKLYWSGDVSEKLTSIQGQLEAIKDKGMEKYLDIANKAASFDLKDQKKVEIEIKQFIHSLFTKKYEFGTQTLKKKIDLKRKQENLEKYKEDLERKEKGLVAEAGDLPKDVETLMLGLDMRNLSKSCQIEAGNPITGLSLSKVFSQGEPLMPSGDLSHSRFNHIDIVRRTHDQKSKKRGDSLKSQEYEAIFGVDHESRYEESVDKQQPFEKQINQDDTFNDDNQVWGDFSDL
jgi:hypothetical protein